MVRGGGRLERGSDGVELHHLDTVSTADEAIKEASGYQSINRHINSTVQPNRME